MGRGSKKNAINNGEAEDQLSLSDIDFDPKQKLTNNFFTNAQDEPE